MSIQMTIELPDQSGVQVVLHALEMYKNQLRASIKRTTQRLSEFEQRYSVTTVTFLAEMSAEDLGSDDIAYVEWAGEAQLLQSLQAELQKLEDARYQL